MFRRLPVYRIRPFRGNDYNHMHVKPPIMQKKVIHKMDRHKVSKQPWEIAYLVKKFGVTKEDILEGIKAVGNGRRKLYKWLRVKMPLT